MIGKVLGVFSRAAPFENALVKTILSYQVLHLNEYLSTHLKLKEVHINEGLLKQLQAPLVLSLYLDRLFFLLDSVVEMSPRPKLGSGLVK